jgi:hypothetical protein
MSRKVTAVNAAAALAVAALAVPVATTATTTPQCTTSQLHIASGAFRAGVGHAGYPIVFTNTGGTCTMFGYPGVDGLAANGADVVHATRTLFGYLGGTHTERTVTLAHGKKASAFFEGINFAVSGRPCHRFKALLVTPPNETHSVKIGGVDSVCYPQIHPVVPGASGRQGV